MKNPQNCSTKYNKLQTTQLPLRLKSNFKRKFWTGNAFSGSRKNCEKSKRRAETIEFAASRDGNSSSLSEIDALENTILSRMSWLCQVEGEKSRNFYHCMAIMQRRKSSLFHTHSREFFKDLISQNCCLTAKLIQSWLMNHSWMQSDRVSSRDANICTADWNLCIAWLAAVRLATNRQIEC